MQTVVAVKCGLQQEESAKYSGDVETVWNNGGFREPHGFRKHPMIAAFVNIESLFDTLRTTVPCGFSGKAIFRMNGGEVNGKPALTP